MFTLTIKNILDLTVMSFIFCTSIYISCLISIKKIYYIPMFTIIFITLLYQPTLTILINSLLILLEILAAVYFSNHTIKKYELINITFSFLVIFILNIITEMISGLLIFDYLKFDENDIINQIIFDIVHIIFAVGIFFIINLLISKFYKNRNSNEELIKNKDFTLILNLVMWLFVTALIIVLYHNPYNREVAATCLIFVCMIIGMNQLLYTYFLNSRIDLAMENFRLSIYNDELKKYNDLLERDSKDIIKFKHDQKNMFYSLGELVNESNNENLKNFYFDKIYPACSNIIQKEKLFLILTDVMNLPLKSLLYGKICEALENNIAFDIEIKGKIYQSEIDIIDLIIILGIYIDNAIEECVKQEPGKYKKNNYIKLFIAKSEEGEEYIIENSIVKKINISDIQEGYTTKGKFRGNGLGIVKNILKKYSHVISNTEVDSNCFRQTITIYRAGQVNNDHLYKPANPLNNYSSNNESGISGS